MNIGDEKTLKTICLPFLRKYVMSASYY